MDIITIFGIIAVALMVIFYALEAKSRLYTLAFAIACMLAAVYGFLVGVWPFSVAEIIWSGVALNKWHKLREP